MNEKPQTLRAGVEKIVEAWKAPFYSCGDVRTIIEGLDQLLSLPKDGYDEDLAEARNALEAWQPLVHFCIYNTLDTRAPIGVAQASYLTALRAKVRDVPLAHYPPAALPSGEGAAKTAQDCRRCANELTCDPDDPDRNNAKRGEQRSVK